MNLVTLIGNVVSVEAFENRTLFRLAVDSRVNETKKETLYIDCVAWRDMATNLATLKKGERVIVTGELRNTPQRSIEISVRDAGRSEKFAKS